MAETETDSFYEQNKLRWWLFFFGLTTFVGLLNFGIIITSRLAEGHRVHYDKPLVNELTGAYTTLLLLPLLFWFFRRFPFKRQNWVSRLPLYLGVSVLFGVTHTMLMKISRSLLYQLFGMGEFHYGKMGLPDSDGISKADCCFLVYIFYCVYGEIRA